MFSSEYASKRSQGIIRNIAIGAFVRDIGQYVIWVIMTVYLNEVRSVSYVGIGIVFMISGLLSVPVSILGGNLIDRIGRRKVAVAIPWVLTLFSGLLFFLIYLNLSLLPILILFTLVGPIQSMEYVTMSAIISDVTTPSERLSGFSALRIASNAGIAIGLVIGGFLSELNYSYIFLVSLLGYVFQGTLYYLQIPETIPNISHEAKNSGKKGLAFIPYRDVTFIAISIIISFGWFITGMFESALTPLYMTSVNHFSNLMVTMLFFINGVIVITCQRPMDRIFRNMRDSARIVSGMFLFAIGYATFALTSSFLGIALAVIVLTVGENMGAPASGSLITKLAPEEKRGAYLGFNSSIGSLINPFRPLVGTALLAATISQPNLSWYTIAFISVGVASLFYVLFRMISRKRAVSGATVL